MDTNLDYDMFRELTCLDNLLPSRYPYLRADIGK